jgi:hypothetical protein
MKKIVLTFGLISGTVLAAIMAVLMQLGMNGKVPLSSLEVVGYTSIIASFVAIFFAIRSYREQVGGGVITFGRAFKVGILVTLISSVIYVASWQVTYWGFMPDFEDRYAAIVLQELRDSGATPAVLAEETKKMEEFKVMYKNPLFNVGMTFMEIFPVGLLMTLIAAAILRRKQAPGIPTTARVAA